MGTAGLILTILVALIFGGAIGFCFGFFIVSLILNSSNNFGDEKFKDSTVPGQLNVLVPLQKIVDRTDVKNYEIEKGMHMMVNHPTYQAVMARSIKKPDDELVTRQSDA